jgi:hypothetical protein
VRGDGGARAEDRGQEAPAGAVGRHGVGPGRPGRAIAIDWSGRADAAGQRAAIWTAVGEAGELRSLANGRDRGEAVAAALAAIEREPATLLGLDFAFSWPRWYLRRERLSAPEEAWARAGALAALPGRALPRPFWGAGVRRLADAGLDGRDPLRLTERSPDAAAAGARSAFQAGGAGTVGLQTIRGMPHLTALRRAGVAIWPFDDARRGTPAAVEIFPRMLARALAPPGAGRGAAFRAAVVGALPAEALAAVPGARRRMLASQDAFDAGVAALALSRDPGAGLRAPRGEPVVSEGWIWAARPASPAVVGQGRPEPYRPLAEGG